jgi:hypothetical protein
MRSSELGFDKYPWRCESNFSRAHGLMRASRTVPMHGVYTLAKPIVAVTVGASSTTTLPSGASIEVRRNVQTSLAEVIWQQRSFVVHLPDLLDACRVEDVSAIAWPGGSGSTSGETE